MKRNSFPLTYKVLLAFIIVLLPILAVFFITYQNNKKHLERRILGDLWLAAEDDKSDIALFLELNRNRIADFSTDGVIRAETEKAVLGGMGKSPVLERYLKQDKPPLVGNIFSRISVISSGGRVVASTLPSERGNDKSKELFFINGLAGPSLWNTYNGPEPEIMVSAPIYGSAGGVVGVISGAIPFSRLSFSLLSAKQYNSGPDKTRDQSRERYLVNRDGLMVTESRFVKDAVLRQRVDTRPVKACLEEKKGVSGFYRDYRGVEVAGASACMEDMGWVLLVEVDKDEALATVAKLARYALAAALAVVLLIGAFAAYFVRIVSRRLKRLVWASNEIGKGNYDLDLPVETNDEIGVLSESFNSMAAMIKERNRTLVESGQRLADSQRIAHIGSWDWDLSSNRVERSDEVYRIFSASREKIPGTVDGFLSFVHQDDRERVLDALAKTRNKKTPFSVSFRIARPDGTEGILQSHAEVVTDKAGKPVKIRGTIQDVTDIKRAEESIRRLNEELERRVEQRTAELDAANREIESFSYSVAHDLRTPLRVIDGFTRILIDECSKADREKIETAGRILSASRRMRLMIDDLLDLSRVMRSDINRQAVDLSALARAIASELRAGEPGRDVEFVIEDNLTANGDLRLLRAVLENLLGNAWKFTGKNPRSRIEFGGSGDEDGRKVFFVRDDGVGFDMKYAGKLFGAFQRLHRADEFPGTGVGLAAVRRVINRHGGRVWAEGSPGAGAVFYFTV